MADCAAPCTPTCSGEKYGAGRGANPKNERIRPVFADTIASSAGYCAYGPRGPQPVIEQ